MEKPLSLAWKYFKKDKNNSDLAQCSICPKIISCKGSSTSALLKHLDKVHKIKGKEVEINSAAQPSSSSRAISDSVQESTENELLPKRHRPNTHNLDTYFRPPRDISEILARLAVKDGISIRAITRSEFIREAFKQKKLDLPKSEGKVMELIVKCYEEKKNETIKNLQKLITSNSRFSTTVDEWTSLKNRRYLNLNLHTPENRVFNLGLVFIPGKCGAAEVKDMVQNHLSDFKMSLENHIVANTSDGASVMKKFGRESPSEMLLCMNHAIHLAVTDVLYTKQDHRETRNNSDVSDSEESEDENENYDLSFDVVQNEESDVVVRPDLKDVLNETRKVVKMFRKSPLKNSILQESIKAEMGKEMQLLLDVKTRWNSLVTMIERFLKIKKCIKKTLNDMNYAWNEQNEEVLQNLVDILNPIKLAVEALSRKDATILTCDAIISVLLNSMQRIRTPLSDEMYSALEHRILERRDTKLFTLCKYLHNPSNFASNLFPNASKANMISYAESLMRRLFSNCNQDKRSSDDEDDLPLRSLTEAPFEIQLNEAINNITKEVCTETSAENIRLKKEFQMYEINKKRTHNLELLYKALLTIKPTSTESERVFSVAGGFVTKTRNRLSDRSLTALVFLKSYFINEQ